MDSVILIVILALCRYLVWRVSTSNIALQRYNLIVLVFAMIIVAALPIFLIQRDIVDRTWVNVVIAGVALFYFPFLIGRLMSQARR